MLPQELKDVNALSVNHILISSFCYKTYKHVMALFVRKEGLRSQFPPHL